jgi:maleate isomerase
MDSVVRRQPDIGKWLHDEFFGWRARIGVINPSAAITFDHEWARMLPWGVSFHVTRLLLIEGSAKDLAEMTSHAGEAARILATSQVNILCYACTLGSMFQGIEGERSLVAKLEETAGVPAVTMARAAVEALHVLGARRVAVANPYTEVANKWVRAFLEAYGIEVVALRGMEITDSWSIAQMAPSAALDLGREVLQQASNAEALFLSCGNMRTIEILDQLEEETGRPVVSSNQAMLWYALKVLGIKEIVQGYGRLLEQRF